MSFLAMSFQLIKPDNHITYLIWLLATKDTGHELRNVRNCDILTEMWMQLRAVAVKHQNDKILYTINFHTWSEVWILLTIAGAENFDDGFWYLYTILNLDYLQELRTLKFVVLGDYNTAVGFLLAAAPDLSARFYRNALNIYALAVWSHSTKHILLFCRCPVRASLLARALSAMVYCKLIATTCFTAARWLNEWMKTQTRRVATSNNSYFQMGSVPWEICAGWFP